MAMNQQHQQLCSSDEWAEAIRDRILPGTLGSLELGAHVLEIGPGYGAATRILTQRELTLTSLEIDPDAVARLSAEFGDTVQVVHGDGTAMPFPDSSFSATVCFTMLHHVPSPAAQDRLFAETVRVLQPGGVFAGSDSTYSPGLADFHENDTFVPIDPSTLSQRLTDAGLVDITIGTGEGFLTFRARRPADF
jgi:SAM-dependent methyltransferase